METIGFIGLGLMGTPMTGHLLSHGYKVCTSLRRSPPSAELLKQGLEVLANPADVTRKASIIITMLPDTPDVQAVVFGDHGVLGALDAGKLVIDMSSIARAETVEIHRAIADRGSAFLDAPVSGGEVGAKAASLSIMVGGEIAAFERALPIFSKLGKNVTHVGGAGSGQATKIANQIVVAVTIQAVAEALLFASKSGADPALVRQALLGGLASSRILELHGERMIKRTFDPGFRIALHRKDLRLALEAGRQEAISLPATSLVQDLFNSCIAYGDGGMDHSALVRAVERLANHQINIGDENA